MKICEMEEFEIVDYYLNMQMQQSVRDAWQTLKTAVLGTTDNRPITPVCCCPFDGLEQITNVRECPIHGE